MKKPAKKSLLAKKTFAAALSLLLVAPGLQAQTIYYVDSSMADNNGNGTSWAAAKKDVQNAINAASSGDQIWVKAGTYKPTEIPDGNYGTIRDYSIHLKDSVKLYGGFTGNETNLAQRNWLTNVTILSGNVGVDSINTDNC